MIRALALCVIGAPALADPNCAPLPDVLAGLAANYGEVPRVSALMTGGNALVITASPSGGLPALEIKPTGEACLVAAGEAFEAVDPPKPGDDT